MRLIDENKLIELTQKDMKYAFDNGFLDMAFEREHLIKVIRNQPTAYDIDKVVEQLEEFRDEMKMFGCDGLLSDLIEVVKGGGVDAESRIKAVPILWETN